MLTSAQLRQEVTCLTGQTWVEFAHNPTTLWDFLPMPVFPVTVDPLMLSIDPSSELWCASILGMQDGFIGLVGWNPPEFPVYFTLYHTGEEFKFWLPLKYNSFNPSTKQAYGIDVTKDQIALGNHAYPYPAHLEKLKSHIGRHFTRLNASQ